MEPARAGIWVALGAGIGLAIARFATPAAQAATPARAAPIEVASATAVPVSSSDACPHCGRAGDENDDDDDGDDGDGEGGDDDEDMDGLVDSAVVPPDVELKMVVLVRQDLNMSKGKIAAQVGHAVLACYRIACRKTPEFVKAWLYRAQAKITLKVDDERTMDAIAAAARAGGLAVCAIEDAGRTEVEPGTRTVLGIGPAPKAEIDKITGPKGAFPLRLLA